MFRFGAHILLVGFVACLLTAGAPALSQEQDSQAREHVQRIVVDEDGTVTRWVDNDGVFAFQLQDGANEAFPFLLEKGYLGIQYLEMTPELRAHYGAGTDRGVLVSRVVEGSPASRAGVQVGDVVVAADGEPVTSGRVLNRIVRKKSDGDLAELEVLRGGSYDAFTVEISEREKPKIALSPRGGELDIRVLGAQGADLEGLGVNLDEAMMKLREALASSRFEEKVRQLEDAQLSILEDRLKRSEARMKALEKRLQGHPSPPESAPPQND